ncbi:ribonuclease P protein subunit p14-like [Stylophora pistillata]|uniref:Ribonuclease P protein subunit p14 n=1 Tax=Stylophora pistillata TaxID=50429 RepID=A0A2B4T178_STYPI|nr:ribonuclease P protein subunit p14-like [Stylophora pistillata]PFX34375.1 Ribonuclease P protein subunit p14 [Stylophora pistillata]
MERLTLPQKARFFYLKLKIEISKEVDERSVEIDAVTFKSILIQTLDALHGKVGSAISVDIIKFEASLKEAILRVKESGLVKLWSALTLLSYYKDKRCAIYVIQVSPYLLSLGADSRQWKINEKEVTS